MTSSAGRVQHPDRIHHPVIAVVALLLLALLLFAASARCASAVAPPTTIYVTTFGDDKEGDGSKDFPFRTITHGVDVAVSGQTVRVADGTYEENIALKSGVIVQGEGPGATTIQGDGTRSVVTADSIGPGARIDGFTITGGSVGGEGVWGHGGGIYCYGCSPTISRNVITGNVANVFNIPGIGMLGGQGGGIYCESGAPVIAGNDIHGNSALASYTPDSAGGGIFCTDFTGAISGNVIADNTAGGGGGVCLWGCDGSWTARDNTISGNRDNAGYGGGVQIFSSSGSWVFDGNTISGNSSVGGSAGIRFKSASGTMSNNIIAGNGGWGVYGDYSPVNVLNNTIVANGGGVRQHWGPGELTVTNSVVWGNGDDLSGCSATYSDISSQDDTAGAGNISANPMFVNPAGGDYHLAARSPCIDEATSTGAPSVDKDGTTRPQDGDNDGTFLIDMGAYEVVYGPTTICVSVTGSDTAGSGTVWNPFRTIGKGLSLASAADTVSVAPGVYNEDISLKGGVVLQGAGSDETTIQGTGTGSVVTADSIGPGAKIDGFTITGGAFTTNGGGIYCDGCSPTISHNRITGNMVSICNEEGAGIYCGNGSPAILDNEISNNRSASLGGYVYGAGIHCSWSGSLISGNLISGNAGSWGGGLYCDRFSGTISNNVIAGNSGWARGAAIEIGDSPGTIVNNTIVGNTGPEAIFYHAGSGAMPTIRNCVIWGNGGNDLESCGATYSDISSQDDTAGVGNISTNPMFVNPAGGDYHLAPGSPCIDEATSTGAPALDKDGTARPQDGDNDGTARPDMGAYEALYTGPRTVYVSVDGSDTAGSGTVWSPFRTIGKGLSMAAAEDTVSVAPGTYGENVTLKSGVVLHGAGSDETTIQGTGVGSAVTASGVDSNAAIEGFGIVGGNGNWYGGGIRCIYGSPSIRDCTISGNASLWGGGISIEHSSPRISGNRISGNTASIHGGGIWCEDANPVVEGNLISANVVEAGGGGGGMSFFNLSRVTLVNNVIAGNKAGDGGAICSALTMSGSVFINNTIVSNEASHCGGISGSGNLPDVRNCIVWGNGDDLSNCPVTYSNISSIEDTAGTGNISADPLFADAAAGNYRLQSDSPCLEDATSTGAPPADRDGVTRPQDSDGDGTALCDMGAFERPCMLINAGSAGTSSTAVTVTSSFLGATQMRVANESGVWSAWISCAPSIPITVTATDGIRTVRAEYQYGGGHVLALSDTIMLDRVRPTASVVTPVCSSSISTSGAFRVAWSGADPSPSAGIACWDVQYKRGLTGAWAIWRSDTASTAATFAGSAGNTYYFRTCSEDGAGNVGLWSAIRSTVVPYDQTAAAFSTGWYTARSSAFYRGSSRYSSRRGRFARMIFRSARSVSVVITQRRTGGYANVYIGRRFIKRISCYRRSTACRVRVAIKSYARPTSGTLKIVVAGSRPRGSRGCRVEIDGIAVGR